MRHASASSETMENNSITVTDLFKICTQCERLSKKVRKRVTYEVEVHCRIAGRLSRTFH